MRADQAQAMFNAMNESKVAAEKNKINIRDLRGVKLFFWNCPKCANENTGLDKYFINDCITCSRCDKEYTITN